MKRAFQSLLVILVAALFVTTSVMKSQALTIIDFDDFPYSNLTPIGTYYHDTYGVYFGADILKSWNTDYIPADPGNYKSFSYRRVNYAVTFDGFTISRFEWDMVTYPSFDPTTVQALDADMNVLYTTTVSSSAGFGQYMEHHVLDFDSLGLINQVAGIKLIEQTNHYIVDNVAFEPSHAPAPVPEPATVLLMGAGLTGLGLYSRRRKRPKR